MAWEIYTIVGEGLDGVLTLTGDHMTIDEEQTMVGRHVLGFY